MVSADIQPCFLQLDLSDQNSSVTRACILELVSSFTKNVSNMVWILDRCAWWACKEHKLQDLRVCPWPKFECIDGDTDPEGALLKALLEGQRHAWVNMWEQHVFETLDVDADAAAAGLPFLAIVYSVLHGERRAYVFQTVAISSPGDLGPVEMLAR